MAPPLHGMPQSAQRGGRAACGAGQSRPQAVQPPVHAWGRLHTVAACCACTAVPGNWTSPWVRGSTAAWPAAGWAAWWRCSCGRRPWWRLPPAAYPTDQGRHLHPSSCTVKTCRLLRKHACRVLQTQPGRSLHSMLCTPSGRAGQMSAGSRSIRYDRMDSYVHGCSSEFEHVPASKHVCHVSAQML